ncbi:MAG TPA: hypothetical protein VFC00_25070 [Micromonosporaceae bacterium]|nr:hypothetical protein [Micromonosporaceae bacterium]
MLASVAGLATLLALGLAAPAQPVTPSPSTPSPTSTVDNTPEICVTSARTVQDGLEKFVARMEAVSSSAAGGDLVAADKGVQDAGTQLVALAAALRVDAARATSPKIRTTLGDLATEFEKQGKALNSLAALQTFDIKRIEVLSSQMGVLCGAPSPSPTPSVTPTPSPTR